MDWDNDYSLTKEEFLYGFEQIHESTGICQNRNFMDYYWEAAQSSDYTIWGTRSEVALTMFEQLLLA